MSYIIRDIKQKCYLRFDRIVSGCDLITVVDPVYDYRIATTFDNVDEVKEMLDQVRSEGQYEINAYQLESPEEILKNLEDKQEQFQQRLNELGEEKMSQMIADMKKQGMSETEIAEKLCEGIQITKEEVEQLKGE